MLRFESKELRVTEAEVGGEARRVVILNDVADSVGYNHANLREMIQGHPILEQESTNVLITSVDGKKRQHTALTHEGVVGVLCRIHPDKIPSAEKRERVIRFQRWAISTLAKVLRGEVVVGGPPADLATQVADLSRQVGAVSAYLQAQNAARDQHPRQIRVGRKWTEEGIHDILAVMVDYAEFTLFDVMVQCGVKFNVALAHMQAATMQGRVTARVMYREDFPAELRGFTQADKTQVYRVRDWIKGEPAKVMGFLVNR